MKLLIDNNLPPCLAKGLGAFFHGQHRVEHIRDMFDTGALPDSTWIEALGREGGWCVLSGDRRIATKRHSRELFITAKLIGFSPRPDVMALPLNRLAARVLIIWPALEAIEQSVNAGCFELGIKGSRLRQIV